MKRFLSLTLLFTLFLAACETAASPAPTVVPPTAAEAPIAIVEPQTLTVFAAASLTDAFTEIGKSFETANPGVTVTFNFAGSQALRTQIEEGGAQPDGQHQSPNPALERLPLGSEFPPPQT